MRTTIISTSKLKSYRILSLSILTALLILLIGFSVFRLFNHNAFFESISIILVWSVIYFKAARIIIKIKGVSFDDSSVYYVRKGFEVQIPFEDIKYIEIKTITGIYNINLYSPSQDGSSIMFKTSLWYPFNFKKQDEKVNELRSKIERYKRRQKDQNYAELHSYNI